MMKQRKIILGIPFQVVACLLMLHLVSLPLTGANAVEGKSIKPSSKYRISSSSDMNPLVGLKLFVKGIMLTAGKVKSELPRFGHQLDRLKKAAKGIEDLTEETPANTVKEVLVEFKRALSMFKKVIPKDDLNKEARDSIFDGFRVFMGFMEKF